MRPGLFGVKFLPVGVVPSPQSRGSITTVEDLLNLCGGQIGRQIGEPPSPDGRYAGGKIGGLQAAVIEISEKCALRGVA